MAMTVYKTKWMLLAYFKKVFHEIKFILLLWFGLSLNKFMRIFRFEIQSSELWYEPLMMCDSSAVSLAEVYQLKIICRISKCHVAYLSRKHRDSNRTCKVWVIFSCSVAPFHSIIFSEFVLALQNLKILT